MTEFLKKINITLYGLTFFKPSFYFYLSFINNLQQHLQMHANKRIPIT